MANRNTIQRRPAARTANAPAPVARLERYDWDAIRVSLNDGGTALLPGLLTSAECRAMSALYDRDALFRKHIVMAQHGYGSGEYKYFAYPLPDPVAGLRRTLYRSLVPLANEWNAALRLARRYPATHDAFVGECHAAGQTRPTPLLLRYGPGDYNRLHQDVYGEHLFPIQVAVLLSDPGRDFTGGEFVLTEQRPRMQSRVEVVPLKQGDAVAFAVNERPARGKTGFHRVRMRHGVSRLHSGTRLTLGIIFHDAK